MAASEVARIRDEIESSYLSAQLGLSGLAYGTSQHNFITTRMERVQEGHQALRTVVGDKAIALVAETLDNVPEESTRYSIEKVIKYELGDTEESAKILDYVRDAWETVDLLIAKFGKEDAYKILNTPGVSCPDEEERTM